MVSSCAANCACRAVKTSLAIVIVFRAGAGVDSGVSEVGKALAKEKPAGD
jgi:hypothetical protein